MGSMTTITEDLTKALLHLKNTVELFDEMSVGRKPVLPSLLVDQLRRMEKDGFLPEQPFQYCSNDTLSIADRGTYETIGKTDIHPLPVKLIHQCDDVSQHLQEIGIDFRRVFVAGVQSRLSSASELFQRRKPLAVIVLPGDIITVKEALVFLLKKLVRNLISIPIIWVNVGDYWQSLFEYVNMPLLVRCLGQLNIAVVNNPEKIVYYLPKPCENHTSTDICEQTQSDNAEITLFFNTTSPNKIRDARRICKALQLPIRVLPIAVLTDGPVRTAEEQSATYQGNLEEKFKAAGVRLNDLGEDFIRSRLKELAIEPTKAYVCAHDGGVSLPLNVIKHPSFHCLRQARTPVILGVETKFALHQLHGAKPLNLLMNNIYNELNVEPIDRSVVQQDTAVFSSLLDAFSTVTDRAMYFYHSMKGQLISEARPYTITPEYFHYTSIHERTLAEWARDDLKSFATLNPFGSIIAVFAQTIGLKAQQNIVQHNTLLDPFRIALLTTSEHQQSDIIQNLYNILANTPDFKPSIKILPDYPTELQDNIFAHSDAFVFMPSPTKTRAPTEQWKSIFAFYSILVGLELDDPFLANKQVILYDPDDTNFKFERNFYTSLYNNGMSTQTPEDMFLVATSTDDIVECLQSVHKTYRLENLPSYERESVTFPDKNNKFNVALYLSASSENSEYLSFTRQLTSELVKRNFGLVSGGAAQGPMGAIHDALTPAIVKEMELSNSPIVNVGIYTRETKLREGIPINKLTWSYQASDVYYRMQLMEQYSDAFIILPGGKGIMQEISKLMIAKCNNHQSVANKHILIYNWQIQLLSDDQGDNSHSHIGFYNQLLNMLSAEKCQNDWLHVVTNIQEAVDVLEKLRAEHHCSSFSSR